MSIEPRGFWQVIQNKNMRDPGSSVGSNNKSNNQRSSNSEHEHTQSIKTIIGSSSSDVHEEEEDYDSYNHLIDEEQDIITYDSDTSASVPAIMEAAVSITRPLSQNGVLDLVVDSSNSGHGGDHLQHHHNHHLLQHQQQHHMQDQMVLVKLNHSDHVITMNGASDLTRLMRPNGGVAYDGGDSSSSSTSSMDGSNGGDLIKRGTVSSPTMLNVSTEAGLNITTTTTTGTPGGAASSGAATNDEELTPLTWLQDKNLIHGINLTTKGSQKTNGGVSMENGAALAKHVAAFNPLICDKKDGMLFTLADMPKTTSFRIAGVADSAIVTELTTKILSGPPQGAAATLTQSGLHLVPATQTSTSTSTTTTGQCVNNGMGMVTRNDGGGVVVGGQQTHHVHKKYRREEHVKILQRQQQQQQQHNHHQSPNGSPLSLPMFTERGMSSKKYAEEMQMYGTPGGGGSKSGGGSSSGKHSSLNKLKHPVNVPYNPFIHTSNKPPLSFSSLIFMAIENASEKALPVKEIYAWIVKHFPYFKTAPTGWKNSVRHNLSLNKCFQKVEKAPNMGKGSLWKVEQQYRQVLMQALTRSPYHQFMAALDSENNKTGGGPMEKNNCSSDSNNNNVLMCNSSPSSSSNLSSTSSSLSTSPTGIDPRHHHSSSSHRNQHRQERIKSMGNGRPFDPVLFPYLSKEISKLDNNNNAMFSNNHYHLTGGDSESESGYYDHMVSMDRANVYHHRFGNGGGGDGDSGPNYHTHYPFNGHVETDNNNMDDVNAATAMLALKHGPKILFEGGIRNGHPVITSSPSEDHTYSAGNESADGEKANGEIIDPENGVTLKNGALPWSTAVYETSDDQITVGDQSDVDLEEQRKKAEGVDALLNLAGFASNTTSQILMKRRASSDMTCFSNENSMDCNNSTSSSTVIFSSPSPTKRSKTRYIQGGGTGGAIGSMATMR